MNKPKVFNYRRYEELRDEYKRLLADNQKLMADNANLRIRLRVAEADRPTVAYICDGRACVNDCHDTVCGLTRDVSHAKNFIQAAENYYYENGE